jgi:hypothetical protein
MQSRCDDWARGPYHQYCVSSKAGFAASIYGNGATFGG